MKTSLLALENGDCIFSHTLLFTSSHLCLRRWLLGTLYVHTRFAFWPASQCKSCWVTACERGIQAQFILFFTSPDHVHYKKWAFKVKSVFLCCLQQLTVSWALLGQIQQEGNLCCWFCCSTKVHSWLSLHGGCWDNIFSHEGFSLVSSGSGLNFNC